MSGAYRLTSRGSSVRATSWRSTVDAACPFEENEPGGVPMRRVATWLAILAALGAVERTVVRVAAQEKQPSVSSGWVKTPASGATSTEAYATVENPTMYAFYLLSATSDVAGTVELRQAGKDAALEEVTVPAYGTLDM